MPAEPVTRRTAIRASAVACAAGIAGCGGLESAESFPSGDWPQVGRDARNAAQIDGTVPRAVTPVWEAPLGGQPWTAPVVADGAAVARGDTEVVAIDPGGIRWRTAAVDPLRYDEFNVGDGVDIAGQVSPVVDGDRVVVPDRDRVLALDRATGEPAWDRGLPHTVAVSADDRGVYA